MPHVPTKICRSCGQSLPASEFRLRRRGSDRRESDCRACHNAACRRHREQRRVRSLLGLAQAAKWRTDRQYLNRAVHELVASFGGAEQLAREYVAHYHRIKSDPRQRRESTDMLLAVVRLCGYDR